MLTGNGGLGPGGYKVTIVLVDSDNVDNFGWCHNMHKTQG